VNRNPNGKIRLSVESPTLPLPPPRGKKAEPPPHIAPLTRDDIARNDLRAKALPPNLYDIEKFLPELRKQKPEQALHILSERFRQNPTPANAGLLQHVVNRIASSRAVDQHMKGEITKAIKVLHSKI
jgi:hypothetical protein